MPSSQTRPHAPHAPPFAVSRHFASSIVGTKVLFAFAIRLMNAESGHSLWHHFLNSSTSPGCAVAHGALSLENART